MALMIHETFINRTKHAQFGDSGWTESYTDDIGKLFKSLREEYGRCTGRIYIDTKDGKAKQVGWIFVKKMAYEDSRPPLREHDYYIREVWVEVADEVETIPTHHNVKHYDFDKRKRRHANTERDRR